MTEKTIADHIIDIIKAEANNNPAPETGTITKIYTNGFVDILLNGNLHRYIESIGTPTLNSKALLVYINGDLNTPIVIPPNNNTGNGSINAVGYFTINNDGHLIVELPDGFSNPYSINSSGHLIYDTSTTTEE